MDACSDLEIEGSVSSRVNLGKYQVHTSPKVLADSRTVTLWPSRCRVRAAASPPRPAPMTIMFRRFALDMVGSDFGSILEAVDIAE